VQQPTEIEKQLGELEVAVDRVRSLYDQYFMGIEKLEPTVPRKEVDRRVHVLRKEQIRNTALRFRFHMILQRYNTFQSHWQRICREIENGTYKRHVLRADRRFGTTGSVPAPAVEPPQVSKQPRTIDQELAELDADFAPPSRPVAGALPKANPPPRPAAPPPRPAVQIGGAFPTPPPTTPGLGPASVRALAASAPRPEPRRPAVAAPPRAAEPMASPRAAAAPPGDKAAPPRKEDSLPEYRVRQLYVEYVETKRRQNESTVALTYDALSQSLRDSFVKLRQKHGKPVDFVVAVRDGKAVLKPVLK
jgi:hypothetical protein